MASTVDNMAINSVCIRELTAEMWLHLPVSRFLGFFAKNCLQLCHVSLFLAHLHIRLEVI